MCMEMSYGCCKEKKFMSFYASERGCEDYSYVFDLRKREKMWVKDARRKENNAKIFHLTVKLLLTFLVLDSATLASVRSTSSKIMDWKEKI